jgi:glyoxylase I family protein
MRVIKRLDHLNIVVEDMDRSVRFYTELFGLAKTLDCELHGPWFDAVTSFRGARARCVFLPIGEGSLRIELLQYYEPPGEDPGRVLLQARGLRHLAFEVERLDDELIRRAEALGARAISELVDVPRAIVPQGKRLLYLEGPDRVIIELVSYQDAA